MNAVPLRVYILVLFVTVCYWCPVQAWAPITEATMAKPDKGVGIITLALVLVALVLLPQPNYFNFCAKKLAHQRCAKLLTILPSTT